MGQRMSDLYDEMIDECHDEVTRICGMEFNSSRALRELDPVAYRCGFADWTDSIEDGELSCDDCQKPISSEDLENLCLDHLCTHSDAGRDCPEEDGDDE